MRGLVKMAISQRLRILLGGCALVLLTGLVGAWVHLPRLFTEPASLHVVVAAAVVLAPLFLIPPGVASLAGGSVSAFLLVAGAVTTVLAFPVYPILKLPRFGWVSVIGLFGWVACQMYVVLAARSL